MSAGDYASLTPVVPGAVPSSWGRDVRDSVVLRFASAAARTSALVGLGAAHEGMATWLKDVDRLEIWNGADWVPAAPLRMTSVTRTANATMTTTESATDTITATLQTGRRYKITWTGVTYSTTASDSYDLRVRYKAGASVANTDTVLVSRQLVSPIANGATPTTLVYEFNGLTAGQTTFGVFGIRTFGGGTITFAAGSDNKTQFFIEDIGV